MDLMQRRRWLLSQTGSVSPWKHKTVTPSSNLTKGNQVIAAFTDELPAGYRWAVALVSDPDWGGSVPNNAFFGAIMLPCNTVVYGLRWRNSAFNIVTQMQSSSYDVNLPAGTAVDLYWTDATANTLPDNPPAEWTTEKLAHESLTRANQFSPLVGQGLADVIIAVGDRDYNTMPSGGSYCCSIARQTENTIWRIVVAGGSFGSVASWTSAYDVQLDASSALFSFSLGKA